MKPHPLDINPAGWMGSEKLDGAQAILDGGRLRTRNGRPLAAPAWFLRGLPSIRLHGELWCGRGTFNELIGTIQRRGADWRGVRFMLFDVGLPGGFQDRMASLCAMPWPDHVGIIHQRIIRDEADLDAWEVDIVRSGGEGLMIRRPDSPYRPGAGVVKIKRLHDDLNRTID